MAAKRRRDTAIDDALRRFLPKGAAWNINEGASDDAEESFVVAVTSWPLAEHPDMALSLSAAGIFLKKALQCKLECGSNGLTLTFAKEETLFACCSRATCVLFSLAGLAISLVGLVALICGTAWVLYRSL